MQHSTHAGIAQKIPFECPFRRLLLINSLCSVLSAWRNGNKHDIGLPIPKGCIFILSLLYFQIVA